jgi:hypothetical protein
LKKPALVVFCSILALGGIDFVLCLRRVLADFGIVTSAFVAAVGWRHWRHLIVARHACFLYLNSKQKDRLFTRPFAPYIFFDFIIPIFMALFM